MVRPGSKYRSSVPLSWKSCNRWRWGGIGDLEFTFRISSAYDCYSLEYLNIVLYQCAFSRSAVLIKLCNSKLPTFGPVPSWRSRQVVRFWPPKASSCQHIVMNSYISTKWRPNLQQFAMGAMYVIHASITEYLMLGTPQKVILDCIR